MGRFGVPPKVHCFEIADLESTLTSAAPFELVESEPVPGERSHLFVVARKV